MTGLTVHRASCMQGSDKLGRPQSPFSGIQHTEFEDSVMPQASSQKEAREVAPPIPSHKGGGTKAAQNSTTGSSPRAEQMCRKGRRSRFPVSVLYPSNHHAGGSLGTVKLLTPTKAKTQAKLIGTQGPTHGCWSKRPASAEVSLWPCVALVLLSSRSELSTFS